MAEFLIYKGPHWMDDLTQEEVDNLDVIEKMKYDARYSLGDIVEVYEDGRCTEPPHLNSKYYIIKVPGISKESVDNLTETIYNQAGEEDEPTLVWKRKWRLNISNLPVNVRNALADERQVTITSNRFTSVLLEKIT